MIGRRSVRHSLSDARVLLMVGDSLANRRPWRGWRCRGAVHKARGGLGKQAGVRGLGYSWVASGEILINVLRNIIVRLLR